MNKLTRNRLLSAVLAVSLFAVMFVPLTSAHDDNGTPDPATPGDHIKQVIANVGSWNNLFLTTDGNVYVNGSNSAGVYGNGTASTPVAHSNTDGVFQQVLASNGDPLTGINRIFGTSGSAVFAWNDTTKTLYGWGSNGTKRLGITSKANAASVLVPTPVNFYGANIQFDGMNPYAYAASAGTTYVLDTHGDVWSWGLIGISGMTGNINDFRLGREIAFDAAVEITETTIAADTAGNNNGIIKASEFSANGYASIRPGKVEYQTQYPDPEERAIAVGASVGYGAILTNKGNVYSWGGLTLSPVGDRFKKAAHPDAASGRKFVKMSMGGGGLTMLLDDQGKIYTLFMNAAGTSISITAAAATTPVKPAALYANPSIANPDNIKFVHVNAANQGANHASNISFAGFADNGDVYAWGVNFLGRAGIGTGGTQLAGYSSTSAIRQSHFEALIDKTSLASTLSANPNFLYDTFSAYSYNGIMLDNRNNRMYTWGTNHYGHLANGIPAATNSVAYQPMPITKPYLKNTPAVAAHAPDGEDPDPGDVPLTDSVANFVFNPPATSATNVLVPSFVGWGGQYNGTLYADISRTVYRVTDENVKNLENKVINLNPQHVRIFYNPRYEMPRPYISGASFGRSAAADENNASFKKVVELAQKSGSTVNVTYWYGPEVNKPLPYNYGDTPADRQRNMQEFAQLIFDLRAAGNTSVQYLTIQNEPKIEFPLDDYQALYQYLHDALVALGIRSQVKLIGGDLLQGSQNAFFQHMDTHMNHILDGYSVHIYWDLGQTGTRDSRLNEVAGIVKNLTNKKPLYVTEYGAKGGNASSPRSMPPFTAFSGNGDNPDPGVAGTGARVSETIQGAYEHAGFNILSATLGYAGLSRWDTYRAKYDSGFQDFSMIAAAYEDYALRPSYWQLLLMTMSTSKGADPIGAPLVWQVLKARAGVDSVKKRATAFQRSDGESTFMLLNETGADNTAISVENLPQNKTYNVYYWNQNGDGKITVGTPVTPAGTVSNHSEPGSGLVTINVNRQAFAVVTTLNLDWAKWDESVGAAPAQTTTPSMIPANKSIDHPLTVKPYVKFAGLLTNSSGTALTSGSTVTGYLNVYRGSSAAGELLAEGTDYTVVYTTDTINGKNYSTLTIQFAKPLVSMTDYYCKLNANMAYSGGVPYPAMSSKFTTGPVAAFSIPSGAVGVPVNTNLVIDFYKDIWPRVGNISEPMAHDAKKAGESLVKIYKGSSSADTALAQSTDYDVVYDNLTKQMTVTFTNPLAHAQQYFVEVVGTNFYDYQLNLTMNALYGPMTTLFTTDSLEPLPAFSPVGGTIGVPIDAQPAVTFNKAIYNASGIAINSGAVSGLVQVFKGTAKLTEGTDYTVNYDSVTRTATVTFVIPMDFLTTYKVEVPAGVIQSAAGDPLTKAVGASFTTVPDTFVPVPTFSPADGATHVQPNTKPAIIFNENIFYKDGTPLAQGTVTGLVYAYANDVKLIEGADYTVTYDTATRKLVVDTTKNLKPNTTYKVEIVPNTIQDVSGNKLTAAVSVLFTTVGISGNNNNNDMTLTGS